MTDWQPTKGQSRVIAILTTFPYPNLADAARSANLAPGTVRQWNLIPEFRTAVETGVREDQARHRQLLENRILALGEQAIEAKIAGLSAGSEHVRHLESSYILDRILGKPKERVENTGKDGEAVKVTVQHEHEFDFDAFRAAFTATVDGSGGAASDGDGAP